MPVVGRWNANYKLPPALARDFGLQPVQPFGHPRCLAGRCVASLRTSQEGRYVLLTDVDSVKSWLQRRG